MASRFAEISENDLNDLENSKDAESTKRIVKRSISLFREFMGEENDVEGMSKSELNSKLRQFFGSVRTKTGEELKKSSLMSLKYGISKFLKNRCGIDINTDAEFSSCQSIFKAKVVDLKKKGKGSTEHKLEISPEDLQKLTSSENVVFNTATPYGLQKKVWFDIMFFLCRRGRENLRQMTKSTFAVNHDSTGRYFVHQVIDEADKNHRTETGPDETTGEARMYARPGDPMCPVQSFRKYLSKLHPDLECLWQRPLDSFEPSYGVWYAKVPLGKNSLGVMMAEISDVAGLSQRYTNHCIRATSISTLDRAGIEARNIMRASGHKSEASIRSYSRRLTESKQRDISDILSYGLGGEQTLPTLNDKDLLSVFQDDNVFVEVVPETASETLPLAAVEFCPTVSVSNDASGDNLKSAIPALTENSYANVKVPT